MTCSERVIVENVRVSARRPRAPGRAHTHGERLLADVQPGYALEQNLHFRSLLAIDHLQASSGGPSTQRTQTRALTAAIKGTRGPRAKHLCGLSRTSDGRRRRTTGAFSAPRAAIKIAKDYTSCLRGRPPTGRHDRPRPRTG